MNIIGLLDIPTSGIYHISDRDISDLSDDDLSDIRNHEIGFIFQGFNLISNLTALGNVELPLIYRGLKKEEIQSLSKKALDTVGLESRMSHLPNQLSGGQQQRVAIARALASRPSIILADEPTGNLDSHSGRRVIEMLTDLNEEGRTVVLITHDENVANAAKRIIRMHDGKIISDSINDI
jgi:putative ABC transport system ATP-binding protein